ILVNGVTYHCPYADILRPLDPEERADLKKDIQDRGVLVPVVVDEHHNVLDGQHRLEIAAELGLTEVPVDVKKGLTDDQKRSHAEGSTRNRRHLTRDEKRAVLERRLRANPELSDRTIAAQVHVDHKTVNGVRAELEGRGEIPHVADRVDAVGRKQPARRPARQPAPSATADRAAAAPSGAAPKKPRGGAAAAGRQFVELAELGFTLQKVLPDVKSLKKRLDKTPATKRDRERVTKMVTEVRNRIDRVESAFAQG